VATNRRNPIHEATLQADWLLREVGRELRVGRLTAGMTQARVAAAIGRSQAAVSTVERGRDLSVTIHAAARHAAAVGMRLWVRVFPDGRITLDAPQLALLGRFRPRLHAAWTWELEVPVPLDRDLRAGDCRLTIPGCSILVEAITRFADAQAQTRAAQRKRRDLGCDRLILLLAATGTNRRALREAGPAFAAAFPISPRAALRALAEGRDPGGDALILL
jgi:transcriptional regulator with XRE-family HTH domain